MKKRLAVFALVIFALSAFGVSALKCELEASLINQDPYPALPGDYVDVVFQLSGLDNPDCGHVSFEVNEEFPFSLDVGVSPKVVVDSGTYARRFQSSLIIPYEIRVSGEALDGDNPIEVVYRSEKEGSPTYVQDFMINIEDVRVDFEITIKDFVPATNTITFEILNVGEHDIEALTIDVPKQDNVIVKGSNRNIVGDLDSNEDTTFKFEAIPSDGDIRLDVTYTDSINVRRTVSKMVPYDSSYFMNRVSDMGSGPSGFTYFIYILIIVVIIWYVRKRLKKRRLAKEKKRR